MCGSSVGEMLATEQDARRRIVLQNDAYGKVGRGLVGAGVASVDTSEMKTSRCLIGKLKDCMFNCKIVNHRARRPLKLLLRLLRDLWQTTGAWKVDFDMKFSGCTVPSSSGIVLETKARLHPWAINASATFAPMLDPKPRKSRIRS